MDTEPTREFKSHADVDEIVAVYLEMARAGKAPNQEELLARYPQFARELAEFLSDQERFLRAAEPVRAAMSGMPPPGSMVRYFGDYELLEEIARGGMGVVYRAKQVSLNRVVALKMILAGQLASAADVQRFQTEAEAAANLDHPNIVPIFEVGAHEGQHFFSMKLIEGCSLAQRPRAAVRELVEILIKVARAIHHAHQRAILHRDLKPSNILVDGRGEPHILDFGLAKRLEGDRGLTQSGVIVGTPGYMAPEQAAGKKGLSIQTDVYALGAILYELLTGRPPFQAATPLDTVLQVLHHEPERPRLLNAGVDRDLETICLRCLEKDPQRRYSSAEALAEDLEHWLAGEPIAARPLGRLPRAWRWCRRHRGTVAFLATAAGLLALVVAAAAIGYGTTAAALEQSNRNVYALSTNLASQALETGDDARLLALLRKQVPERPGQTDRRGWEWHYLRRRCRIFFDLGLDSQPLALAWSPDGRWLATGEALWGKVRLWEIGPALQSAGSIGRTEHTAPDNRTIVGDDVPTILLDEQRGAIHCLDWSPDGKRLATGGPRLKVWDVETRTVQFAVPEESEVLALAWSHDGNRLAALGKESNVAIWDATTGRVRRTLAGKQIHALAWGPNDEWLALSQEDETTTFWDPAAGRELRKLEGRTPGSWSRDGRRFVAEGGIFDAATGGRVLERNQDWIRPATTAWSPDGRRIAQKNGNTIEVWSASTGKTELTLRGRNSNGYAWSPDGRWLAAGDFSSLCVWDVAFYPNPVKVEATVSAILSFAWSPDSRFVATGGNEADPTVKVWNAATGEGIAELHGHTGAVSCIGWCANGAYLASIDTNGPVKVWDTHTWREVVTLSGLPRRAGENWDWWRLDWSPDGRWLAASGGGTTLKVWEAAAWQEVLSMNKSPWPAGCWLAGWMHHKPVLTFLDVNLAAEAKLGDLATSGFKEWDPSTGDEPRILQRFQFSYGEAGAWSPDDRWFGGYGLQFWSPQGFRPRRQLGGHSGGANATVGWTPDCRRVASSGYDGTVKIWDFDDQQELLTLAGVGSGGTRFSPDGHRLAAVHGKLLYLFDGTPVREERSPWLRNARLPWLPSNVPHGMMLVDLLRGVMLSLLVVCFPVWAAVRTAQQPRSWKRWAGTIAAIALAGLIYWLSGLPDGPLPRRRVSTFELSGVPQLVNLLVGVPLAVFLIWVVAGVVGRRWRIVALLFVASVVLSLLGAAVLLFEDWRTDSLGRYAMEGWYTIWFGAAYLLGVVALAAILARPVYRLARR